MMLRILSRYIRPYFTRTENHQLLNDCENVTLMGTATGALKNLSSMECCWTIVLLNRAFEISCSCWVFNTGFKLVSIFGTMVIVEGLKDSKSGSIRGAMVNVERLRDSKLVSERGTMVVVEGLRDSKSLLVRGAIVIVEGLRDSKLVLLRGTKVIDEGLKGSTLPISPTLHQSML
jgi:hypothetical protein